MGDILAGTRVLQQRILERVRRVELQLGVEPSHYEPGSLRARPGGHHRRGARPRDRQDRGPRGAAAVSTGPPRLPTGNTFDKYGSSNPVVRRLMAGFHSTLDELWAQAAPESILDVGCGEGVLTAEWAERLGDGRIVGIDLERPEAARRVGEAPAAEPRVPGRGGHLALVRRRRVRHGQRDRGARARARARRRRSPRWRAWRAATCSCRCRASRSGAVSTWLAARTGATSATRPAT